MGGTVGLWAGPLRQARLYTLVLPTRLDGLVRARRRLALSRPDAWSRRGLMEEVRLLDELAQHNFLKTRHFLVDFGGDVTAADLGHWGLRAQPALPQMGLHGDYAEAGDHMRPVRRDEAGRLQPDHSRPFYTILSSHRLQRTWDWQRPLAERVRAADGPLILCVDVRRVHPERVTSAADFWRGMLMNSSHDREALRAQQEAEQALAARGEAVHHVRVLFLLLDPKLGRLRRRARALRSTGSQYFQLDSLHGYQAAASGMFSPVAHPPGLPQGHHNAGSRTVALTTGLWGVGREQGTQGIYAGIADDDTAPHVCFLNWRGKEAFHGLILGGTGGGKTVFAQALAWRLVEQGVQSIFIEPQGHCRRLAALAGGEHVSYHEIAYEETRLNVLDVVYAHPTEQYDHVITLLALLLDPVGQQPRRFDNAEVAAIRRALQRTYAHYEWEAELLGDPSRTPTLETLCHHLAQIGEGTTLALPAGGGAAAGIIAAGVAAAARRLAQEIGSLYVHGDYAAAFNAPSNLDLSLRERLVLFNLQRVPAQRRALFYYALLANIHLQVRRHPRRRAIFVDEVHYLNQEASLLGFLAQMVKTVRTYGAAVVMIDQDLETFLGVEGATEQTGIDVASGQFIANNVAWSAAFAMPEAAAARLARQYPGEILASHVAYLARLHSSKQGAGQGLLRDGGRAQPFANKLRHMEQQVLIGS